FSGPRCRPLVRRHRFCLTKGIAVMVPRRCRNRCLLAVQTSVSATSRTCSVWASRISCFGQPCVSSGTCCRPFACSVRRSFLTSRTPSASLGREAATCLCERGLRPGQPECHPHHVEQLNGCRQFNACLRQLASLGRQGTESQ